MQEAKGYADCQRFEVKAVNPNAVTKVDGRTPQEIIGSIKQQGRIVSESLARITTLIAAE